MTKPGGTTKWFSTDDGGVWETAMNLILNILWLVFGGFLAGLGWFLAALVFAISLVGLPWAASAFRIGMFTLWPFGNTAVARDELTGRSDIGTSILGQLGNLIWLLLAGWWLALGHLSAAFVLACTVIGIPFAWQHVKLALLGLWPIGMTIVPNDVAEMSRRTAGWNRAGAWRR